MYNKSQEETLLDRVCLIIGGGRGMGAATARQMHSRDYALALMSPTESCETLATELGGSRNADVLKVQVT